MSFIPINNVGSVGLIRDIKPHRLPVNAWSELSNARMFRGTARFFKQEAALNWGTANEAYTVAFYVPGSSLNYWVVAGLTEIYCWDGTTLQPITRGVVSALTGSIDPAAGTAQVGVGTAFLTELVAGSDYITVTGETRLVTVVTDDTNLTVAQAMTDGANDPTPDRYRPDYYASGAIRNWNGGVLSGILVLNNGVDEPQYWADPSSSQLMQDITGWPAGVTARVVRPFKAFLVALDITKSGTRYPYMVKWSDGADPGAIPSSWDETDSTKLAGEYDLGQTEDYLVDSVPLGDINVLYKESTVWGMQFIGAPFVFRFWQLFETFGAYNTNCAVEYKINNHAVLTRDDFIVHNGQDWDSVLDKRLRGTLHSLIDPDNWEMTFLYHNSAYNEVWVCIPEVGASACTLAFVWNYRDNCWGHRTLPNVRHIAAGVLPAMVDDDTWDNGPDETWDGGEDIVWNEALSSPSTYKTVVINGEAFQADISETDADGVTLTTVLERTGLGVEELRADDSLTINLESWKFVAGLRPRFSNVTSGDTINISVGVQDQINADVQWSDVYAFDPETDLKMDVTLSGRLVAVRFQSTKYFELDGYDLDIVREALY